MTQDEANERPDLVVDHAHRRLLLLALAAVAVVPATYFALAVWRRGLLDVLSVRASILDRPLFFSLKRLVKSVKRRIAHFLRLAMLLFLNLSEDEREEVLEGLSPEVHDRLFRRPLRDLIPRSLRRLLLGPVPTEEPELELSPADEGDPIEQPSVEFGRQWSQASNIQPMQRLLARWTVGRYVHFVGSGCLEQISSPVRRRLQQARQTAASHAGKVSETLLKPWLVSVALLIARAAIVAAVSSSCALIGTVVGAAIGLPLALPTLGLSIPIAAMIGSIFCGCSGLLLSLAAVAFVSTRSGSPQKSD